MMQQPPEDQITCQLCNHAPLGELVVPGRTTIRSCPKCGLYQSGPFVDGQTYEGGYQVFYENQRQRKLRTATVRLNRIAPLVSAKRPRLLDIGCSIGCILEAGRRRGWQVTGVDVADDMVELCREQGFESLLTSVDDARLPFDDESFDVITSWHVIEHVPDVLETLAQWRRVLRVGGVLAIETPNAACGKVKLLGARYKRFWRPEHTYAFTPHTLGQFFQRAGFELLRRPVLGRLSDLPLPMAAYTVAYQLQQGVKRVAGSNKAFQIFARRCAPEAGSASRAAA